MEQGLCVEAGLRWLNGVHGEGTLEAAVERQGPSMVNRDE